MVDEPRRCLCDGSTGQCSNELIVLWARIAVHELWQDMKCIVNGEIHDE